MKKFLNILALAAVVLAFGGATAADAQGKFITLPRMKWNRGISSYGLGNTDSTRISIPSKAPAVADWSDTTAWLDLGDYQFDQAFAKQPLVLFQINKQLASGTDSVTFSVQFSNDAAGVNTTYTASSAVLATTVTAATAGISSGSDGYVTTAIAVSPDAIAADALGTAATLPRRFVRLVVDVVDVSGSLGRQYVSVTPLIWASR